MKRIYLTILSFTIALSSSLSLSAQKAPADTVKARQLDDFVIEAPKVVKKADMDVFYPSESAVTHSKDGMTLLRNLMIPALTVDNVLGTIKTSGEAVEVRINGRTATIEQVRNLLPQSIKKIEWMDNPGLRYNGAAAVLNFIVVNPTAGGSLMAQANPALNIPFGRYNASLKLNRGRSQWGLSAGYKLTNHIRSHRDYVETFTFPDGEKLTRVETPVGGYMSNTWGNLSLDYSYIKPDTTVFWVALSGWKDWPSVSDFEGKMSLSSGGDDILLHDSRGNKGFTPTLSAYLEQHLSHNQLIAVDFSASMYNGTSFSQYLERNAATQEVINDVNRNIKDRNQAYGLEADYIKKWKSSRLTAGVSYSANRNRSEYDNLDGAVFHQRQDKVYFFGEYFQRFGKFSLTAGVGGQYIDFRSRESGKGNSSWNVIPKATLTYSLNSNHRFMLNFTSWQTAPSLSETNSVPQQIDGLQWQVGNPELHASSSYRLQLRYNFTLPRVMGTFGIQAFTSPNAITSYMQWHDGKLVTSYENSKGLQNLRVWLSPQIEVIPNWLTLSGTLQYRAERMRGTGYRLYNHDWSGDVTAMLSHWNFQLIVQYERAQRRLWGESISWGETISMVVLNYSWKKFEFAAGVLCPFTKYDQGSKSLSKYNTNEMHYRINMSAVPFLQISYNLQWGHQKRGASKLVNASSDVDRSASAGR